MRKRPLGKTGLTLSELGLGTWGLSGGGYGNVDEEDRAQVVERALALGITTFETADVYAAGEMERLLGKLVPSEESHVIITKIGTDLESSPKRKRFDPEFLERALDASQERLARECLDVVLLHNPSEAVMSRGKAAELLTRKVEEKRIRAWGISAGTREVVWSALDVDAKPQVVQMAYNALHTAAVSAVEHTLDAQGIGLLARSVLAHGLLTGAWRRDKTFDRRDHRGERWTSDQLQRRLFQLRALRDLHATSLRAAALNWVLDNPRIASAVLGPRSTLQLDQLVREAGSPPYLDAGRKQRVTHRLGELGALR